MRVWVHAELRDDKNSPVACELGRWATFDALPRVGEDIFWSDGNYPGWSMKVSQVEHFLQPGEDEAIVRLILRDEDCGEMGVDGWHCYRDWLVEAGFRLTDRLWETDE